MAQGLGTSPKRGAKLGYHLLLGPFMGYPRCPTLGALLSTLMLKPVAKQCVALVEALDSPQWKHQIAAFVYLGYEFVQVQEEEFRDPQLVVKVFFASPFQTGNFLS